MRIALFLRERHLSQYNFNLLYHIISTRQTSVPRGQKSPETDSVFLSFRACASVSVCVHVCFARAALTAPSAP